MENTVRVCTRIWIYGTRKKIYGCRVNLRMIFTYLRTVFTVRVRSFGRSRGRSVEHTHTVTHTQNKYPISRSRFAVRSDTLRDCSGAFSSCPFSHAASNQSEAFPPGGLDEAAPGLQLRPSRRLLFISAKIDKTEPDLINSRDGRHAPDHCAYTQRLALCLLLHHTSVTKWPP